jgi:TRAP-type C4-dicarboxylate transport system permease small subunit
MRHLLKELAAWLRRRAEDLAVALLAIMFISFVLQIVFRYVFNWPTGWSFEVSIIAWLWCVLWGAAFVVTEKDEIRFGIVYGLVRLRTRRIFATVTGLIVVATYSMSLPAVVDYVRFMRVERSASLGIRFDWLYSIYVIFAVAAIIRYLWLTWAAIRGRAPVTTIDPDKGGSATSGTTR